MKAITLASLWLVLGALLAWGQDKPAATAAPSAPKGKVTFEYTYPPLPPEKPKRPAEVKPLPRAGSAEWLRRVDKLDRSLLAPWERRRLEAWRECYAFAEPPPTVDDFTSTWR